MAEDDYKPPQSADELLRRYAAGEREFHNAKLRDVDLTGANLAGSNLSGADLSGANLTGADLSDANLIDADLSIARLSGARLSGANLGGANLLLANLTNADLFDVDFTSANLSGARLGGANLQSAGLGGANLSGAEVAGADLSGAEVGFTTLADIDLSPFCDADPPVTHAMRSTVDHRSIVKSLRSPNLKNFLQRTGVPEVFINRMIECAISLNRGQKNQMMQSTFISYGKPDEAFAKKLYEALLRNGVTAFFFPEHAVPGKKLHRTMRDGVNEYDRVILVCSKESLTRSGVLNEIEETLTREAAQNGEPILIPIRLDDYLFTGWSPPDPGTAKAVRARVVADFEGADTDPAKFDAALLKLIAALTK